MDPTTGNPPGERHRYRVEYQTRKNKNGAVWTKGSIEVIARSQEEAEDFALQIISEANQIAGVCECCDYTAELLGT